MKLTSVIVEKSVIAENYNLSSSLKNLIKDATMDLSK